jgi:hypothetical protein
MNDVHKFIFNTFILTHRHIENIGLLFFLYVYVLKKITNTNEILFKNNCMPFNCLPHC